MSSGSSPDNPRPRAAARVILLDSKDRILLFQYVTSDTGYIWWCTPGGGLDPGETHEQAALRELREEAGVNGAQLGPWLWTREHVFPFGGEWLRQRERFYLARVPDFVVDTTGSLDYELEMLRSHRWWTAAELAATDEVLAPRGLGRLLQDLLRDGPPAEPIEIGL